MHKLNILVTNDDGIEANGLKILAQALSKYGNVYVSAPDKGRSAASHSIVINQGQSFEYVNKIDGVKCYKTSGTPADCVRLSTSILKEDIDIVFSGINHGLNIGTDIIYSGTVAAAREAHIEGIASVAISTDSFDIIEKELPFVLDKIFNENLYSKEYTLNINFPIKEFKESKGIVFARQGKKRFKTEFGLTEEGLYHPISEKITYDTFEETDVYLASKGYITFVPLKVEQTDYEILAKLKEKNL